MLGDGGFALLDVTAPALAVALRSAPRRRSALACSASAPCVAGTGYDETDPWDGPTAALATIAVSSARLDGRYARARCGSLALVAVTYLAITYVHEYSLATSPVVLVCIAPGTVYVASGRRHDRRCACRSH